MSEQSRSNRQRSRAAFNRDFIWTLLWRLNNQGSPNDGWATSASVYRLWLDGRSENGIAFASDYLGSTAYFSYVLRRLVVEGRAERRKHPGRHPEYRTVGR